MDGYSPNHPQSSRVFFLSRLSPLGMIFMAYDVVKLLGLAPWLQKLNRGIWLNMDSLSCLVPLIWLNNVEYG